MSQHTREGQVTNEVPSNRLRTTVLGSPSASELRELIANRAYELYNRRGGEFGDELSDWLAAEGEVVTMLLAESQETAETEGSNGKPATRTADSLRTTESAISGRPRVTRRPKRALR